MKSTFQSNQQYGHVGLGEAVEKNGIDHISNPRTIGFSSIINSNE